MVINGFTGTGIKLHVNHDKAVIINSHITNTNGNGVSVFGETVALELINNTFQHNNNSGNGIFVLVSPVNNYVSFYASGNVFHSNHVEKVIKLYIRDAVRSVIRLINNDMVKNNCENLVYVEYKCLPSSSQTIVLANNQWSNNQMKSSAVVFKKTCSAYKTNILLMENDISDNTGSGIIDIQSSWLTTLILNSNLLHRNALEKSVIYVELQYGSSSGISLLHNVLLNNTAEKLFDVTGGNPTVFVHVNDIEGNELDKSIFNLATGSEISLLHNTAIDNSGFHLVDISGDSSTVVIWNNSMVRNKVDKSVLNLGNHNSVNITGNNLIANGFRRRYPLFYIPINNASAVICSSRQISVNKNFFENPLLRWEFLLTRFFGPYEINAQYNWWGTNDQRKIILRIFDFHWRSYLARLNFSPFLASANVSDVTTGGTKMSFRDGNRLGGHVTDYVVLQKDYSPYVVIRDVVIHPNATLRIEKGVQINIVQNVGFHVYGKLELVGEWGNPIKFDIAKNVNGFDNFMVYPVRLVNGSKPYEGIVEILYNNTWGTICDEGVSPLTGHVLCKQLGYQGYSASSRRTPSSSISSKPVWWRYLKCDSNTHDDISSCSFQGWGVTCYNRNLWTVRCDPGYWRGIRFRETAKASTISNVKFYRGGVQIHSDTKSFVLHFDVLRQSLSNVEIRDPFRDGIKIGFQEPGSIINNVEIQDTLTWLNGHGIETSSTLTFHNCTVSGKHRGFYFEELSIQNFLNDRGIKFVDALAVPELMLRREILMCDQNMSVVVGREDLKIITIFSSKDVECLLALRSLSSITLVAADLSASLDESINISTFNLNTSSTKEFTTQLQREVYTFGPSNLTLRYWKKTYQRGARMRLVIFSSQGNVK